MKTMKYRDWTPQVETSCLRSTMRLSLSSILAHGAGWEVTAVQTIDDVVRKILEKNGMAGVDGKEGSGKLELHYTSGNESNKCIITLLNQCMPKPNGVANGIDGDHGDPSSRAETGHQEVQLPLGDMINSRL